MRFYLESSAARHPFHKAFLALTIITLRRSEGSYVGAGLLSFFVPQFLVIFGVTTEGEALIRAFFVGF